MKKVDIPVSEVIKKGSLIEAYLSGRAEIEYLYNRLPERDNFLEQIQEKNFPASTRSLLVQVLNEQYEGFEMVNSIKKNLDLLKKESTFTLTTGHQLCLATGPLYFIYKIVTTIKACQELKDKYDDFNFVPVFWMATEDHDFKEINHFHLYGNKIEWNTPEKGAVGRFSLEGIDNVVKEITSVLGEGNIETSLSELIAKAYSHNSLSEGTRYLVNELFKDFGLVIIDADSHQLKSLFKSYMVKEIEDSIVFKNVSDTVSNWSFKTQVNPRKCNLFYLAEDRLRIDESEGGFKSNDNKIYWTKKELIREISEFPERFSPNVILRPLYQEVILPNLAYIGGPGELAYWLELKSMFDSEDVQFPILMYRDSIMILDKGIQKRMNKLDIEVQDLYTDLDKLIKRIAENSNSNIDLSEYEDLISKKMTEIQNKARELDQGLSNSIEAENIKMMKSLSNIQSKILRTVKKKEEERVNGVRRLKNKLFPDGLPQERKDNFISYYLATEGKLIDILIKNSTPFENDQSVIFL